MAKKDNTILIVVILVLVVIAFASPLGNFAITGNEKISRSMPSTIQPGQTFTVSYVASGTSGSFGVSILDEISGGCKFSDGTNSLKYVLLSPATSQSFIITAPSSGSCVFHGDYKFGQESVKNMVDKSIMVTISGNGDQDCTPGQTTCDGTFYHTCSSGDWVSQGQIDGKCGHVIDDGNGNGDDNGDDDIVEEEVPTLDLNKVLFNIGTFGVTAMYLIIFLVAILLIKFLFGKK